MKLLSTLLCVLLTASAPVWLSDFSKARTEAEEKNRPILLNFSGSDWCIPCIRMHEEYFRSEVFSAFAEKELVLVKADFPRLKKNQPSKEQVKANEVLADKYNPEGKFPFTVLLDAKGNVIRSWDGIPRITPEAFVKEINQSVHGNR
jgi:thiol-disulfide isomerase/thioredoxin